MLRVALIIVLAFVPIAHAIDPPPPQRSGWHMVNGVWVRAGGTCNWSDLVRITWQDDGLSVEPQPTELSRTLLRGGRSAAVEIGVAQDLYEVGRTVPRRRRRNAPAAAEDAIAGGSLIAQLRSAVDDGDHIGPLRIRSLLARRDSLQLNARGMLRGNLVAVSFVTDPRRGVHLSVNLPEDPRSSENIVVRADSLDELVAKEPLAARRYLSPLLRVLTDQHHAGDPLGPGASDVYMAFSEVGASKQAQAALLDILPRMIDDDARVRQEAMDGLRALGPPGVCAALRLDFDSLMAQQQVLIETFVSEHSRRGLRIEQADQAQQMRGDAMFLVDCLEFPDAQVRAIAIDSLRRTVDPKLSLDPFDARECVRRATSLRERLLQPGS